MSAASHRESSALSLQNRARHRRVRVNKEYHEDLFPNVLIYVHGCGMGMAVFERIEAEDFDPNVSLEHDA